jgi:hypothetical protein
MDYYMELPGWSKSDVLGGGGVNKATKPIQRLFYLPGNI